MTQPFCFVGRRQPGRSGPDDPDIPALELFISKPSAASAADLAASEAITDRQPHVEIPRTR
jgi:hypothetical protein